ncbi:FAD-binding oxidoreductase, partial [archaeon]
MAAPPAVRRQTASSRPPTRRLRCRLAGAHILEHTPVTRVELGASAHKLHTARGSVTAKNIVLAGSAYMPRLAGARRVSRAVLPVMTYACVTEPLGDRLHHVMRAPHAVTDSRFACDYYRPLSDGRILWGGRIDCLGIEPSRLADKLHADMCVVYPQLADVRVDVAWPGVMGYARHKMPLLGKLPDVPGVWYATGFGGHGVCPTTVAGELIAAAIAGTEVCVRVRVHVRVCVRVCVRAVLACSCCVPAPPPPSVMPLCVQRATSVTSCSSRSGY